MLCVIIKTEEVKLPREFVFSKHGMVQHSGVVWKEIRGLRYHPYLIWEDVGLKDAVLFGYGDPMQIKVQNGRQALMGDGDPLYTSDEKKGDDDDVSTNTTSLQNCRRKGQKKCEGCMARVLRRCAD